MTEPAAKLPPMTHAEYVAWQEGGAPKAEWVRGEVFVGMSGGTFAHNRLASQILGELYGELRGRPCRVLNSDQRVRVIDHDQDLYPDVTVVCGDPVPAEDDPHGLVNPVVVVEVLSPSTEAWDRGGKFAALRSVPSLAHYVLVRQDQRVVERFTRNADGTWTLSEHRGSEQVALPAIGASLALDAVYDGVC